MTTTSARERERLLSIIAAQEKELDHRADVIVELADQAYEYRLALLKARQKPAGQTLYFPKAA